MTVDELLEKVGSAKAALERELDQRLADKRLQFAYQIRKGKVFFESTVRTKLRSERTGNWKYISSAPPIYVLTAPIIYAMVVPIALLDAFITLYQHTCFRVYGIALVKRKKYVRIDRHRLPFLNTIEKLNCAYCGYGNGVLAYAREVAARTEQY